MCMLKAEKNGWLKRKALFLPEGKDKMITMMIYVNVKTQRDNKSPQEMR